MNTQHLQYILEIERTRSISQAAENLFVGQPNLSRILNDMESALGFRIFERTNRGVRPTERGESFLGHARSILRELDSIEALGPRHPVADRLRVCLPRSAAILKLAADYLAGLPQTEAWNVMLRECHPRQALELLAGGEVEFGILRFRREYRDYFAERAGSMGMKLESLGRFWFQPVLARTHPLAQAEAIGREDLAPFPEVSHGELYRTPGREEGRNSRIYAVDRLAQVSLLKKVPGSYLWAEPWPKETLQSLGLVQKPCGDNPAEYEDALLLNPRYRMNDLEAGFYGAVIQNYNLK